MKYIVEIGSDGIALSTDGVPGTYLNPAEFTPYEDSATNMALQLVKQGVTVDEILKLKNAELI